MGQFMAAEGDTNGFGLRLVVLAMVHRRGKGKQAFATSTSLDATREENGAGLGGGP